MKKTYILPNPYKESLADFAGRDKNLCYLYGSISQGRGASQNFVVAIEPKDALYIHNCNPWDWTGEPRFVKITPEQICKLKIRISYWPYLVFGFLIGGVVSLYMYGLWPQTKELITTVIIFITIITFIIGNLFMPYMCLIIVSTNPLFARMKRSLFFRLPIRRCTLKLSLDLPLKRKNNPVFLDFLRFKQRVKQFHLS